MIGHLRNRQPKFEELDEVIVGPNKIWLHERIMESGIIEVITR